MIREHVMKDLRPYVCTIQNCSRASKTYASRRALLTHGRRAHGLKEHYWRKSQGRLSKICAFCEEVLSSYDPEDRSRHLARHMEEIAFTVVTKPHEDWDFYSYASSLDLIRRMESQSNSKLI